MRAIFSISCLLLVVNCGLAIDKFKLSSGYEMPAIGLGTGTIKPGEVGEALANALEIGYRHIDTAFNYQNEAAIGSALRKWFQKGGRREELFITTKLPHHGNRAESVEKYLKHSLKNLDLDFVDMYLIHMPYGTREGDNLTEAMEHGNVIFENVDHLGLWRKMEEQVRAGRAKSTGLSNFNQSQILNVYNNAEIKPSNLEVEIHAYFQQDELREFCNKYNIIITAYSPLGSPIDRHKIHKETKKNLPSLLELLEIKDIAKKHNKTAAQILLGRSMQAGLAVIPKSTNKDHQMENYDSFGFNLNEEDIEKIKTLEKGEMGRVFDFLGFFKGLENNPQYPFPITS